MRKPSLPTGDSSLVTINEIQLQATDGHVYPLRSLAWTRGAICDACIVQADYGHLLVLTTNGALHGVNFDTGSSVLLCTVDLPVASSAKENECFGAITYQLHASSDGRFAAIVVDHGQHGIVVEVLSGVVTMNLDGGNYCEETVPFGACFLRYQGRHVLVHRSDWNRLDAADPATGQSLTERHIASYEDGAERPEHYLDYFHGQLRPSPGGSRLFDDGWVWHPLSIPRSWSMTAWLASNPWESEDGSSLVDLTMRDDWTTPACWINEHQVALWGLAVWDDEKDEEVGRGTGVRIFDVNPRLQSSDGRWPMELDTENVLNLFSDSARLFVAADTGTTVWDFASRTQLAGLPAFTARLLDLSRNTLVAFDAHAITELPLPWPTALGDSARHD